MAQVMEMKIFKKIFRRFLSCFFAIVQIIALRTLYGTPPRLF